MWWDRLHRLQPAVAPPPLARKPTAEDFTPRALQQAVLQETLQHPATLVPAALAAVAALWSLAIDLSPAALLVMLGCGFVSVGAWVINYIGRGDRLIERRIQQLRALRQEYERRDIDELMCACGQVGFSDGAKEAQELTDAYTKLQQFLQTQRLGQGDANGERFAVLAEETYRHGISLLQRGLNLFQALQCVDVNTLERERQSWIRQREQASSSESVERSIEAHSKRLDTYHKREEELATLIAQLNELETALETAYLEIIDLISGSEPGGLFDGGAATHLERAVEAARRVEQRLRGVDDDRRADEEYLSV